MTFKSLHFLSMALAFIVAFSCTQPKDSVAVGKAEARVSSSLFYLNSLSEAEYFSLADGENLECDIHMFSAEENTSWALNDTIYRRYDLYCDTTEVVASGTHTNTLVYSGEKVIGFNVGRSYILEGELFIDSLFRLGKDLNKL